MTLMFLEPMTAPTPPRPAWRVAESSMSVKATVAAPSSSRRRSDRDAADLVAELLFHLFDQFVVGGASSKAVCSFVILIPSLLMNTL